MALAESQLFGVLAAVFGVLANAGAAILGRGVNRSGDIHPLVVTVISMGVGSVALLATGIVVQGLPHILALMPGTQRLSNDDATLISWQVLSLHFREGLKRPDKANIVDQFLLWDQLSEPERATMLRGLVAKPDVIAPSERAEWIRGFSGVCLSSDAYIPFRDNIDRAYGSNVRYVAQTGSSLRDDEVTQAANEYGMVMVHTGLRCFLH